MEVVEQGVGRKMWQGVDNIGSGCCKTEEEWNSGQSGLVR